MAIPVHGPSVRKFCGKDVDIMGYVNIEPPIPQLDNAVKYTPKCYTWIKIKDIPNRKTARNQVRKDQTTEELINSLKYSYERNGWQGIELGDVPIVNQLGELKGGFHRVESADRIGEEYIPALVIDIDYGDAVNIFNNLELTENQKKYFSDAVVGAIENVERYREKEYAKRDDYVAQLLDLIDKGILQAEETQIRKYLNLIGLDKTRYPGEITTIVNSTMNRWFAKDTSFVKKLPSDNDYAKWFEANGHMPKGKNRIVLSCKPQYATRALKNIINSVMEGKGTPECLLWTGRSSAQRARKDLKVFRENLDSLISGAFLLVQDNLKSEGIFKDSVINNIVQGSEPIYKIAGLMPQIDDRHDINSKELVPVDNY